MGVMYSVFPLQSELCDWLDEQGVVWPEVPSRNPTLAELKAAIARMPDLQSEASAEVLGQRWSNLLTQTTSGAKRPWCMLQIIALQERENEFYVENGDPVLILQLLAQLCESTGPLVLITDAGDIPRLVQAGDDAQKLFDSWGSEEH